MKQIAVSVNLSENNQSVPSEVEQIKKLTSEVCHDINNLLHCIHGQLECVLLDLRKQSKGSGQSVESLEPELRKIQETALSAADLVCDLMLSSAPGNPLKVPINLNGYIDYLAQSGVLGALCEARQVKIDVVHGESIDVAVSDRHLTRALMNTICNSIDSGACSINIRLLKCELSQPKPAYEIIPEGTYAGIEISDNGSGLDEKFISRIFEPSFSTKQFNRKSGFGIGLSVVHGFVKSHDGYIDVRSKEGEGATFILYLPLKENQVI